MSDSQFPFQSVFQHAILKCMLKDADFLSHCSLYVKDEYFENIYLGWLFNKITRFYTQYEKCPSIETIKNEVSKFSTDERLPYDTIFEKVLSCDYDNEEYLRDQLSRFIKAAIFMKEAAIAVRLYNSGEHDAAYEAVAKAHKDIDGVDFSLADCVDFDNLDSIMETIRRDNANKIKLGIPLFDKALNGGAPKKSLIVYIGTTNVGKSMVLTQQAVNIIKQGHRVFYVDVEMDMDIVVVRFLGCITGINLNRLTRNESLLTEEERSKIREAKELMKKYLKIKLFHEEDPYIETVSAMCQLQKKKFDFDVMVVDSGQDLATKDRVNSTYERKAIVHQKLSRIALSNDVLVITAAQGNREAARKNRGAKKGSDLLRKEDIADSYPITWKAGIVITITRSEADEVNNRLKLLLDKQRLGRTNIAVTYTTDFDSGQIFGPDMQYEAYDVLEEAKDE